MCRKYSEQIPYSYKMGGEKPEILKGLYGRRV